MLLFTLPAGYLADVYDRRNLMMWSLLGATLTSIALGLASYYKAPVEWLYFLLFLDATFLRIGWPARAAILPLLVPQELFENAVKWRTSLMQITGVAGPAIGGVLIAINLQTSFLTPPFGFALFYLRGVAPPEVTTAHIYRGIIPFVLIQVIGLYMLWEMRWIVTIVPELIGR